MRDMMHHSGQYRSHKNSEAFANYITHFCLSLLLLALAISCSKKTDDREENLRSSGDESVPSKVMSDGKTWMTENLDIALPYSYCQQDDTVNCIRYGRLYTWKAAREGCNLLGAGWRLPSDAEWRMLAESYGGIVDDSNDRGKAAYESLLDGGQAGFNAMLGGNREENGNYERLGAHGFYWTSTESDTAEAWFYNFAKGSTLLNRHTGSKERAISVRCVNSAAQPQ